MTVNDFDNAWEICLKFEETKNKETEKAWNDLMDEIVESGLVNEWNAFVSLKQEERGLWD